MPIWERALITGASSGIGREFARGLASQGTRLVVVARRQQRLEELALELEPSVAVEVFVADLRDRHDVERVASRLGSHREPIDLLINNAAMGRERPLVDAPVQDELDQIGVNVTALVALSHAAARRMIETGRGTIINVSSIAGNQPRRDLAVYGATKAFVTAFSQSLASELEGTGVTCTLVIPGLTDTEFHPVNGFREASPRALWMRPDDVAAKALDAAATGRRIVIPGTINKVLSALATPRPGPLRERATRTAVAFVKNLRRAPS
ncbi:MAG: SDR family NAD(P)-dependent oxidoreductase [Acidimicrobiales bacterium]